MPPVIAGLYYEAERLLSRELMIELETCDFMRNQTNIIIEGPTGAGKTYIVCAIAKAAIGKCYRVKYIRLPDLQQEFERLSFHESKLGEDPPSESDM